MVPTVLVHVILGLLRLLERLGLAPGLTTHGHALEEVPTFLPTPGGRVATPETLRSAQGFGELAALLQTPPASCLVPEWR